MRSERDIREKMELLEKQFESHDYWAEGQYEILEWVLDEDKRTYPYLDE